MRRRGIYSIAPFHGWNDQQLTKNCGLLLYLFYKEYGFRAVMVGTCLGEYPSLDRYVAGLEMDFLPDAETETGIGYIREHAKDMDVLVLHGPWQGYIPLVDFYRQLRPDGKIYLELDLNIYSAERLEWNTPAFRRFLQQCDVIGASCRRMQDYLSQKWPCIIDYIPNGFYNFAGIDLQVNWAKKENLILTVGRIGTEQKHNELLVEAYAALPVQYHDWKLALVGPTEARFMSWLHVYMDEHPQLQGRVVCTGKIMDKKLLLDWYKRAKIFAMTSELEGGTPNVAAEAMFCGCYMVTSDIDSSADMTDEGRCGRVFPIGNRERLAAVLAECCGSPSLLAAGGKRAVAYAQSCYDFLRILPRLYYLLFHEVP